MVHIIILDKNPEQLVAACKSHAPEKYLHFIAVRYPCFSAFVRSQKGAT